MSHPPGPRLDLERLPEVTAALAARAEEYDRAGSFPADGIAAVHTAGLLTATVAGRYGGPGAGLAQTVAILRALGRGDPSVALITAMTLFLHAAQAKEETWPGALYAGVLMPGYSRSPHCGRNALGLTALYLGVASAARDWLIGFLSERADSRRPGQAARDAARFQGAVGEIEASLTAADDLVAGLAARADADDPAAGRHAGIAKLSGTRAAIAAVEQAVTLVGNNGLTRRYPLERHYRDVLCARVHTPQDDSVIAAAGQSALAAAPGNFPQRNGTGQQWPTS